MRTKIFILLPILALTLFSASRQAQALTLSPVRFELSGDPGATISNDMILINEGTDTQTFYSSFANFEASGETGTPSFVDATSGLATWVTTVPSVTLAPREQKVVTFTIHIPANAEPGGNFAALFWGTNPPDATSESVSIGAKTGVLLLLRVNGAIDEKGGILEFNTIDNKHFFTALPVPFYFRFQNAGADRIFPKGDIVIHHFLGITRARVPANQVQGNILPQSVRRFETSWQSKHGTSTVSDLENLGFWSQVKNEWRNFAFGYYKATLALTYGANDTLSGSAVTHFWVVPWQLLLVVLLVLFIVTTLWRKIARQHRNTLMEKMRAEVKKELANETPTHEA